MDYNLCKCCRDAEACVHRRRRRGVLQCEEFSPVLTDGPDIAPPTARGQRRAPRRKAAPRRPQEHARSRIA